MADWSGTQPAYEQVAAGLRRHILEKKLGPDDQLPTYDDLMKQYGVSVTVVRRAISVLINEGTVVSHQGKGIFVRRLPDTDEKPAVLGFDAVMQRLDAMQAAMNTLAERIAELEQGRIRAAQPDRSTQRGRSPKTPTSR